MEGLSKTLDYLPTSLSNGILMFEPILIYPPQKYKGKETYFDGKVKSIPRTHFLEKSFRPYFRASKQVNAIKNMYKKYGNSDFDVSVEDQIRFLHKSPKNTEFKTSRVPEKDRHQTSCKRTSKNPSSKLKDSSKLSRFPPINDDLYKKFDINLSYLSISNAKHRDFN